MRHSHFIMLCLAVLTGVMLYQIKYKVMHLEEHLSEINRQIIAERESIHVLHAEISYMSRPDYISRLSEKHLNIAAVRPDQVHQLADYVKTADVIPLFRNDREKSRKNYQLASAQAETAAPERFEDSNDEEIDLSIDETQSSSNITPALLARDEP